MHRITFDSITEQPRHRAEGTRDGIYLRIPWSDLETFGISRTGKSQRGKSVVELHVQNTSKPGELVKRYFASGESSSSVRILMRKENAREGDVFRLVGARNHHIADFLKDYDAFPSENTKNLKLSLQKDALAMAADGQEIRLRHPHLKAFGSRVSLSARLEGSNKGIKFQFDGERVTTRFSGGKLNEVNGNKHGIEFSYSPSRNMDYSFRQSVGQFDRNLLIDNLTFVTKPEREGEPYLFEVSPHLQESVEFRLGHTANFRKYLVPQGHISEEMQRHMLSLTEMWEEVKDHPFGKRLGPDSLQRSKLSDELYYFELKWEQKKGMVRTLHEGTQQVLRDYHECSSYKHERVAGAYVGMLDWDGGQFGYFWIERVWPEATRNE